MDKTEEAVGINQSEEKKESDSSPSKLDESQQQSVDVVSAAKSEEVPDKKETSPVKDEK